MKSETKVQIKETLLSFVKSIMDVPYDVEELKKAYPFHALLFSGEAIKAFKKQRTVVTKMGQQLIPQLAEIIAKDLYKEVYREYEIVNQLDLAKIETIDKIVNELRQGRRVPDHDTEVKEIFGVSSSKKREIRLIADLYIWDFKPGPLFFEMKSPRPNLDICAESKKKILQFLAIFESKKAEAFLALYYNPYYPGEYKHPFTRRIMDLEKEVLIGQEMWNKIGGKGTYEELLEIIDEVAKLTGR